MKTQSDIFSLQKMLLLVLVFGVFSHNFLMPNGQYNNNNFYQPQGVKGRLVYRLEYSSYENGYLSRNSSSDGSYRNEEGVREKSFEGEDRLRVKGEYFESFGSPGNYYPKHYEITYVIHGNRYTYTPPTGQPPSAPAAGFGSGGGAGFGGGFGGGSTQSIDSKILETMVGR